jgi:hypothetical protein
MTLTLIGATQAYKSSMDDKMRGFKDWFKSAKKTKATRFAQANRLLTIAIDCVSRFDDHDKTLLRALPDAQAVDDVIAEIDQRSSRLSRTATELAALIRSTRLPRSRRALEVQASSKATWAGVKSQSAILGGTEDGSKAYGAAYQLVVMCFSERKVDGSRVADAGIYKEDPQWPTGGVVIENLLENPSTLTSCHPTAIGIRNLMARPRTVVERGGAGAENRLAAIEHAKGVLRSTDRLYVVQLQCCATDDGHSFSLLMNHDGTVSVVEGWAMAEYRMPCTYVSVWRSRFKSSDYARYLSVNDVCGFLDQIASEDIDQRDIGYGNLSSAYGRPARHPAHHFEEKNTRGDHDEREKHSIIATSAELRPREKVIARLNARLALLKQMRAVGKRNRLDAPCTPACKCWYCTDHTKGRPKNECSADGVYYVDGKHACHVEPVCKKRRNLLPKPQ